MTNLLRTYELRTYKLFQYKLEYENYLWLNIPKYRVSLCRLRTSSHNLEIERGRYTVPKTLPENRLCNQCEHNLVEDEIHFIFICQKYEIIRHNLLSVVCNFINGFKNFPVIDQFKCIMSSQNEHIILALAKFCYLAFSERV